MAVFFKRNRGYQVGVLLLLLGLSAYVMGLSAPYWTEYQFIANVVEIGSPNTEHYHGGLWDVCQIKGDGKICRSTESISGWYMPVKVLQCIGLIGYAVAICYAAVVNCREKTFAHRRLLEISTGISSLLGLVGVLMYVAKVHEELMATEQDAHDSGRAGWTLRYHLSWAFYLDLAGCLGTIVATVQIGLYNRPVPQPDDVPILSAGSDDMQLARAQGLASASGVPGIITDFSAAQPPPYYVLYPQMYDNDGFAFPKPSDEVEGGSSGRFGEGGGGSGGSGGGGGDGAPRLPSYEDAVAEMNAS